MTTISFLSSIASTSSVGTTNAGDLMKPANLNALSSIVSNIENTDIRI